MLGPAPLDTNELNEFPCSIQTGGPANVSLRKLVRFILNAGNKEKSANVNFTRAFPVSGSTEQFEQPRHANGHTVIGLHYKQGILIGAYGEN